MGNLTIKATDKNRGLDLNGIESLEPMILMSASAADIDAATLDDATEGNDVMIALEAGGLMDGKAGHDILIGLAGDNYLEGGDGHDLLIAVRGDNVIDGGEGQDTLVYWGGNRAGYKVTDKGFGILEIDNGRSTDFVTNVEEIQFRDGTYSVADLFKAGSALAAPSPLVVDADAPVEAEDGVTQPAVPVAVAPTMVKEPVAVTMTQMPAEAAIVEELIETETDEIEVVEVELDEEDAEVVVTADQDAVIADEEAEEETDVVMVDEKELVNEEAEEPVVADEEVVIADEIAAEEIDEIVVVAEEVTEEEAEEEGEPGTDKDDDVWACVDEWVSECSPDCEHVVTPVDEEVVVIEELVDCIVEPPVPVECEVDYNWCYSTSSYTDCNRFRLYEPMVEKYVSVVEQICDFSFSYDVCDDKYSSKQDTSYKYSGWSSGRWSKWFGCW